jgi:transcription antitermination factor NusG
MLTTKLNSDLTQNKLWFILKTKSNFERKVYESLLQQGFEAYLPTYTTLRIWSDRKKKIEAPLIPTYVFVFCEDKELVKAAQTNGVAWIMKDLRKYAIVKDYEIQNIRIFLAEKVEVKNENLDDFQIGEAVKIVNGAFNGLIGTALHKQGEYRVRITISGIGTNFTVTVPKSQLERISD